LLVKFSVFTARQARSIVRQRWIFMVWACFAAFPLRGRPENKDPFGFSGKPRLGEASLNSWEKQKKTG